MRQHQQQQEAPTSLLQFSSSKPTAPGSIMAGLQQTAAPCSSSRAALEHQPSACGSRTAAPGSNPQAAPAPAPAQGRLTAGHSLAALGSAAALPPGYNREHHRRQPAHAVHGSSSSRGS